VISFRDKAKFDKQAAVICLTSEQVKARQFPKKLSDKIKDAVKAGQFEGTKAQVFPILSGGMTIILLGLGKEAELTMTALRIYLRRAFFLGYLKKIKTVEVLCTRTEKKRPVPLSRLRLSAHTRGRNTLLPRKTTRPLIRKIISW